MKLKIDTESDALYFRLDDSKIFESEEVEKGVILDFNEKGNVVGIEMLNISERTSLEQLKNLHYETA